LAGRPIKGAGWPLAKIPLAVFKKGNKSELFNFFEV
jgi:hypothetical protein